jgi:hypothetical protein
LVSSNSPYILGAGQAQQKYDYFYFNCKPQPHLPCTMHCNFYLSTKLICIIKPKVLSELVYRRRTDNTMAKRKGTKGKTTIYKTYTYN